MIGPIESFDAPDDRPFLWAPAARSVEVARGGTNVACEHVGEHWIAPGDWPQGTRYRFVVDGVAVPDPRSWSQPDGVHGESEWLRPELGAPWSGAVASLERAVIYELHLGTFSAAGTFLGAIDHLDHLVDLGVTHVELMPVAAFDGEVGWGYDGVALFATHPAYGTFTQLRRLVDACHERGLAVLVDVVLNHLGPSGNYLSRSGPYFTDRYSTPWGDALNLDGPGADGVRRHLIDVARHWLEHADADGLRLDAVHALFDTSAVTLLEQLADEVRRLGARTGRPRLLVAESDRNDPRLVTPAPVGTGLDGVWSDDLHHTLHVALTGERRGYYEDVGDKDLQLALREAMTHQGRWSPHRRRTVGRSAWGTPSSRFVVCLQNHDQVGNRAAGERLHHLVGVDRTVAAAALVLLSPFAVLVFQGEEWATSCPFPYFSDHAGELGEAVRDGRLAEFAAFGWPADKVADPQDRATFAAAVLRWDELDRPDHAKVLSWYRALIELRRSHPAFAPHELPDDSRVERDGSLVLVRRGALVVLVNLGEAAAAWSAPVEGTELLRRGSIDATGDAPLRLGPGAVLVLERR